MSAFGATPGPTFHELPETVDGVVRAGVGRPGTGDAEARGRTGDVRSVAEAVERVRVGMRDQGRRARIGVGIVVVAGEIGSALDLRSGRAEQCRVRRRSVCGISRVVGGHGAGPAEVGVRVVDPRVDHGDLHALSAEARSAVPHGRCVDQRNPVDVVRLDLEQRVDAHHARQGRQLRDLVARDAHLHAVVGVLIVGDHLAAERLNLSLDSVLLGPQLGPDLLLLFPAQLGTALTLYLRDGRSFDLHHHGGGLMVEPQGRHVRRPDGSVADHRERTGSRARNTGTGGTDECEQRDCQARKRDHEHCSDSRHYLSPRFVFSCGASHRCAGDPRIAAVRLVSALRPNPSAPAARRDAGH